ncbi:MULTISPECIES: hypothetical protein [Bradyrhizobium]|jgi:hypothetical protein|uniref:Secreted protein n=2 Tax=Bradyrhizobium TaxID=374 RepID=A0ABY0QF38_9BRAD|nr:MULTISPECIES: hypothetical protein [Bradyrhizobium]SDK11546.1 hypothetical protein SAMN05444163_7262 [Bradyrhizobium ottawaense]SEE77760.1 hypothetical protein SAMN05444171_8000 [Bradyrhizobium lablabi]SHM53528.1 hypothetical protein SAMN05444321_6670 [Bradyrhizobium lablabi]
MHVALRGLGLGFLLLCASSGAASAMDPSATEETNCLMACDANQEHCASTPHVAVPKNYSVAAHAPSVKIKPLASSRRPIEGR